MRELNWVVTYKAVMPVQADEFTALVLDEDQIVHVRTKGCEEILVRDWREAQVKRGAKPIAGFDAFGDGEFVDGPPKESTAPVMKGGLAGQLAAKLGK